MSSFLTLGSNIQSYVLMVIFSFQRLRVGRRDLGCVVALLTMPLMYVLGFRGHLKTPIGRLYVRDREVLKSSVYGLFKTNFCYLRNIRFADYGENLTVVDVGANIGDFTLGVVSGSPKSVVAIEPGSENFDILQMNMRLNQVKNTYLVQLAAHHREETVHLHGSNSDFYVDPVPNGHQASGKPLDGLISTLGLGIVDIVKIDVQGHEKLVLEGMNRLLSTRLVRLIIVEVHEKRQQTAGEITSLLQRYGYRLTRRDEYLFEQPQLYFMPDSNFLANA